MEPMRDASKIEQRIIDNAKLNNIPINGCIELTPLCNMNCNMCYVRLTKQEQEKRGRLKSKEEWLALAQKMKEEGVLFLLLTGGEPLSLPDFKYIYCGLQKLGMILTVNTNGTLINEDWADFFMKYKPRRINITLYGSDETAYEKLCHYKDGYEKTINAIKLLKQSGVDVRLGCSVTPNNIDDIEKIRTISDNLGVPLIMDSYMFPATRERDNNFSYEDRLSPEQAAFVRLLSIKIDIGEDNFLEYLKQSLERVESFTPSADLKKMVCIAGKCSFAINWQGDLFPCIMMNNPKANVFEKGFKEAWNEISESCQNITIHDECAICKLRPLCKVCPSSALAETGRWDGKPDYLCRYTKEFYRLLKNEDHNIR